MNILANASQRRTIIITLFIFVVMSILIVVCSLIYYSLPTSKWLTYTNEKYNYSFKYPTDWPISECVDPDMFPRLEIEGMVSFQSECGYWPNYKETLGTVTVQRFNERTDPQNKIRSPFADEYEKSLEPMQIGNAHGYFLKITAKENNPTRPASTEEYFYVVSHNLVYEIRILGQAYYHGRKSEQDEVLKLLLSTFRF